MTLRSALHAVTSAAIALVIAAAPADMAAQSFWKKLTGRSDKQTEAKAEDTGKTDKKQKKSKKNAPAVESDPMEMSLDENLLSPAVPAKQHEYVKSAMNTLAKELARLKRARVETLRHGEVVVATLSSDILFGPNDTTLRTTADDLLRPYAALLDDDRYKILLTAHTDDTGSEAYTDRLSAARVNAVADRLSEISSGRNSNPVVVPYAMGASEPLKPNTSSANRSANRRVEIYIVPTAVMVAEAKRSR